VALTSSVRIQFSRDLDPSTIRGHIKVSYAAADTTARGELDTPGLLFTSQYQAANRVLELKFASPLERFRTVHVDLIEGIIGTDKQPVAPWRLTFITGG
jgi:hypothetical protein